MDKLFFIIGIGRSGTTLLQSMLNAHPEITSPPESHFVQNYIAKEIKGQFPKTESRKHIAERLTKDVYLSRLDMDIQKILNTFFNNVLEFSYTSLFIEILKEHCHRQGKPIVGEKDPTNTSFLKEIHSAFPQSFIIHIIRDPRDVILSKSKTLWGKNASLWKHIWECKTTLPGARRKGRVLFGQKYLEILYEKLVTEPQKELIRICKILDVSFHDEMLQYYRNVQSIVTNDEMPWKKNVFKPVLKDNTQKWKQGLSKWRVLAIEGACVQQFRDLGYSFSSYGKNWQRYVLGAPIYPYIVFMGIKRIAAYILKSITDK
jgi:hypothetical protein